MSNDIYLVPKDELYHYGVKGMKWGVRKERYTSEAGKRYSSAKKNRKTARNDYLAAYNDAADYEVYHPSNKTSKGHKRAEADRRWADAEAKEKAYKTAKEEYKNAKKEYKQSDEYAAKKKQALQTAAAYATVAAAMYGYYKLSQINNSQVTSNGMDYVNRIDINRVEIPRVEIPRVNPMDYMKKYNGDLGYFY